MPNIKISDLQNIAPGFDPDAVFLEAQQTVAGEEVSRKISVTEVTAGASPLNATYVTVTANAILPNERILTEGTGISIVDGGAGGNITVSLAAGFAYFSLAATNRVTGSDAGASNTGDNVFLAMSGAGANNIADNIIAIGVNALNAAVQLDFEGSIAIGTNAGVLLDDTRDPWLIIGHNAVPLLDGASFHDGNTVIGHEALLNFDAGSVQQNTLLGYRAGHRIGATSSALSSSVIIGAEALGGSVQATLGISACTVIGRDACGSSTVALTNVIAIGNAAGESLSSANDTIVIGNSAASNSGENDNCVIIGTSAHGNSTAASNLVIIGNGSGGWIAGDGNVLLGNNIGILSGQSGVNRTIIIGHNAGSDLLSASDTFSIELPVSGSSGAIRPYLWGNLLNSNLALLSVADTSNGLETGTRLVPTWGSAQGVFSMSGAGTDLAATTDTDMVHFYVRNSDNNMMFRFEDGSEIALNSAGFTPASGVLAVRSVGNTDTEARLLSYQHADGTQRAFTGNDVDDVFNIVNEIVGGNVEIFATDAASALRPILVGDPDVDTTLTGDVDLNLDATTAVNFNINSSAAFTLTFQLLAGATASSAALRHDTAATTTTPTVLPGQDFDTGLGGAGNTISVIVEGIQYMLLDRVGNEEQITLSPGANLGDASDPFLAWGDGDSGWYEETDDEISLAIINQEQFSVGLDGKLFVNTLTGSGAQGSNIVSATPASVVMYAAGSATNGVSGGNFDIWAGYAAGMSPAAGGDVRIWGGGGGGGAATGGNVRLIGGEAEAAPGDVILIGGTATVSGLGGSVTIDGGPGFGGNNVGGNVLITGGDSVGTGNGGEARINGGSSGPGATGNGGAVRITGGAVASTDGTGGLIRLLAGDASGTGVGGAIDIDAGDGTSSGGNGGAITINGGQAVSGGAGVGGAITISGGNALGTGAGGAASLTGGNGSFNADGGLLTLSGGDSGSNTGGAGGNVSIEGGSPLGTNGDGGDINLIPGALAGAGADGAVNVTRNMLFSNAAGPAIVDEAATGTNPTLIPNKTDLDTGLGWTSADVMTAVVGGEIAIEMTNGGDVALRHNNVEVARTDTTANGGFEVDAGDGFFRVLNLQNQELRRVDGDQGVANDATSNAVSDLTSTLTLAAGEHGIVEGMLRFESASATPGVRWQLDMSGAALTDSSVAWTLIIAGGTVEGDVDLADVDITHTMGANVEHVYKFFAAFTANAAILPTIAFAQETSNATQTRILDGSWVKYSVVP